jgi:hypothetical protein
MHGSGANATPMAPDSVIWITISPGLGHHFTWSWQWELRSCFAV